MSREELSVQTGINEQVIEKLESDFNFIGKTDASVVFCLAQTIGCRMEDLMEI